MFLLFHCKTFLTVLTEIIYVRLFLRSTFDFRLTYAKINWKWIFSQKVTTFVVKTISFDKIYDLNFL